MEAGILILERAGTSNRPCGMFGTSKGDRSGVLMSGCSKPNGPCATQPANFPKVTVAVIVGRALVDRCSSHHQLS